MVMPGEIPCRHYWKIAPQWEDGPGSTSLGVCAHCGDTKPFSNFIYDEGEKEEVAGINAAIRRQLWKQRQAGISRFKAAVEMLANGYTSQQVAEELKLRLNTVYNYKSQMKKSKRLQERESPGEATG